jgi:hypothetical protein
MESVIDDESPILICYGPASLGDSAFFRTRDSKTEIPDKATRSCERSAGVLVLLLLHQESGNV